MLMIAEGIEAGETAILEELEGIGCLSTEERRKRT